MTTTTTAHTAARPGFTLIELLVSMLIIGIIMIALTGIFGQFMKSSSYAKLSQQAAEDGQFAMNHIAKVLRTSSVVASVTNSQSITVYDYSLAKCAKFSLSGGRVVEGTYSAADKDSCSAGSGSFVSNALTAVPVTSLLFTAISSDNTTKTVGKASITMTLQATTGPTVRLQTTVSLRDYDISGLL